MRKLLTIFVLAALNFMPPRANASVNISINVVQYPVMQRIPGYPVYYAPRLHANYFFYDGLYWVYVDDEWYASPWYNGPWDLVAYDSVPLFILRVPVRYYRYPPVIFSSWTMSAPPRWDRVWGPDWAHRHPNWQRWNRAAAPAPAPLPRYQQRYSRTNYPDDVQRRELTQQHYRYAPRDQQARQKSQAQVGGVPNQPPARPSPQHQSRDRDQDRNRAPLARAAEPQNNHMRPIERERFQEHRQPPPRANRPVQHERQAAREDFRHDPGPPPRGHNEERGRPDKLNKHEKDEGHDSGKRH